MQIWYDPSEELAYFQGNVMWNSYFAFGFGSSMRDTAVYIWQSRERGSTYQAGWAYQNGGPKVVDHEHYRTFVTPQASHYNNFLTSRPLPGNGTEDFTIPLDQDIKMVYAYLPGNADVHYHHHNYGFFNIKLDSTTGDCSMLNTQQRVMSAHGWMMWLSWTVICMAQISLNRYYRTWWRYSQTMHNVLGSIAGILTLVALIIMLKSKNGHMTFSQQYHSIFGIIMIVLAPLMIIGGWVTYLMRRGMSDWSTTSMLKRKRAHMYFGYFIFFTVQLAVCTGILVRIINMSAGNQTNRGWWIATVNLLFIIGVMTVQEFRHRQFSKLDYDWVVKKHLPSYSENDINAQIANGRKLMVLNQFVLDCTDYISYHPGGRFVIETNVGRDISKFFYGGYCLEGNGGSTPSTGYNHSNYAMVIANDLAIAINCKETNPEITLTVCNTERTHMWTNSVGTVFFEAKDGKAQANFKNFYDGFHMLGKHYKLRALKRNALVHRHYTICNTMRPEVHNGYLECLRTGAKFNTELLSS